MKALPTLAVLCLSLVLASTASAGATDWWPWKSTGKATSNSKSKSSKSKSSTKKPFAGSKAAKGSSSLKMPNVLGTVSNNTKKAYRTTKAKLLPAKKKSEPPKLTGSRSKPSSEANDRDTPESTSMFGSLMASKKEPEPPRSIKEWMKLPRLDP
jgi:hypothetical protein